MDLPESLANKSFWIVANFTFKDKAAMETVKPLVQAIKKSADNEEPGTLNYQLLVDATNELKVTVVQQFANSQALEAHKNTAAFKALDPAAFIVALEASFFEDLEL